MRQSVIHTVIITAVVTWSSVAEAEWQTHRETAFAPPNGQWSVGILNPLEVQLDKDWGIEVHPLAALAAPHLNVHHVWVRHDRWALMGVYGLSIPSWSLKFEPPFGLRGYLSPKCVVSSAEPERRLRCGQDAWVAAPKVGARYSRGRRWIVTLETDLAVGILLSGEQPRPLDTYAPLEQLYTPMTHNYRLHVGARVSRTLPTGLIAMAEADMYRVGDVDGRSPWAFSTYVGVDVQISRALRGTLGVIYWNSDQRAMVLRTDDEGFSRKEMVRSHDVYPTIDLIWTY